MDLKERATNGVRKYRPILNSVARTLKAPLSKLIAVVSTVAMAANAATAAASAAPAESAVATTAKAAIDWKDRVANYVETHGPALLSAIVILAVGFFVARWLGEVAKRWLSRKELQLEPPVQMLFPRLLRLLVMAFALVTAAGGAGKDGNALVASVGVAGVGVGLATQGVLSNVVAGLTIIFTKPFRVGEYIEMLGVHGQVTAIELFSTTLAHPDRSRVVIPNRKIVGEVLHNYGTIRQLDLSVGVAYTTNIPETVAMLRDILKQNPRVLKELPPGVGVSLLADSSINLA